MKPFIIKPIGKDLYTQLQHKINAKTKPLGALGDLEEIAIKIGQIQCTETPILTRPTIIVFAGDHGIAQEGVSAYPQEVTFQMVMNFLGNGAAINVFCNQYGIDLKVVDAGVNFDFSEHSNLINAKIAKGTKSFLREPAMTDSECGEAINKGAEICSEIHKNGSNIIGFGEMGIGNTSAASLVMSKICNLPVSVCVGRGTGLDDEQLKNKIDILEKAAKVHEVSRPLEILRTYGGFEMAMMYGAMVKAAELGMVVLVDGFIATSVFLVANAIHSEIMDYSIFCHQSDEHGHARMLEFLKVKPILKLGLRLGEGTGCALAYPVIKSSVAFLNEMASFESADVSQKE